MMLAVDLADLAAFILMAPSLAVSILLCRRLPSSNALCGLPCEFDLRVGRRSLCLTSSVSKYVLEVVVAVQIMPRNAPQSKPGCSKICGKVMLIQKLRVPVVWTFVLYEGSLPDRGNPSMLRYL